MERERGCEAGARCEENTNEPECGQVKGEDEMRKESNRRVSKKR
jgi:hypothetical protein